MGNKLSGEESKLAASRPLVHRSTDATELNELRESVERWLKRASKSLMTFYNESDGTVLLDTKHLIPPPEEPFNTTTTARAYKAMVCATWRINDEKTLTLSPKIIDDYFAKFLSRTPYLVWRDAKKESDAFLMWPSDKGATIPKNAFDKCELNNFDTVHLTDYLYALHYLKIYANSGTDPLKLYRAGTVTEEQNEGRTLKDEAAVADLTRLRNAIVYMLDEAGKSEYKYKENWGKVPLVAPDPKTTDPANTYHFFVTLHALRALSILDACPEFKTGTSKPSPDSEKSIVDASQRFCIEQCFYASRGNRHEFDCTSLVFALVIYVTYSKDCDKDLVGACLEAISQAQTVDGSWPATHPIIRKGGKPWHITSHELALSLSWLYFQPRLLDSGRQIVLDMLEKYFKNWVIKTHVNVETTDSSGWFDDHTISRDFAAGWVTAIVCDFLGNYHNILCDNINRRVIETLGIETSSKHYLIDEDASNPAVKWKSRIKPNAPTIWPDLPPLSWPREPKERAELANLITSKWTDPLRESERNGIAFGLAGLIKPIVNKPAPKFREEDARLFLLPGPPGTRKTSLVKRVPEIVNWPLIIVPAATFFEDGFDHLLTRATHVFRNLGYLRGCVIFFDEFEEFFRERFGDPAHASAAEKIVDEVRHRIRLGTQFCKEIANADVRGGKSADREFHDRTIAAFITSSMLPHLQTLHDDGFCFVFVATNSEDTIDRAIQRPGRFDLRIEVPHPTVRCLSYFLKAPTKKNLENLDIPIPKDAETGTEFAAAAEWQKLAAEMQQILNDLRWRNAVISDLKKDLMELKANLTGDAKKSEAVVKCIAELSSNGVISDDTLCVPFRALEEAMKSLKASTATDKEERCQIATDFLKRRLDAPVQDLKVDGS